MTTMENKRSTYQQRYEAADDGLRFQDLTYTGNFVGLEPVTDGIKGDKMMRSRAKSGVLERVSKDDVLRDQFFFMQRCGFDAIQPKAGKYSDAQLEESLASLKDFSAPYQAAVDQPEPLFRRAQRAT